MRRVLLWGGGALLILAAICGGLVFAFIRTFSPSPPKADYPPPHSLAEAQQQDLDYFGHYLDLNRAYAPQARDEAAAMLAAAKAKAGAMTAAQFELAIAQMVGLADNGHSAASPGGFRARHNKLPCMLYRFSDGNYVVRARPACQELLGARLDSIDGHSATEIADRVCDVVRGPRNHCDQYIVPFYLESPEMLYAMGLARASDRVTLRVRMPDGPERDVVISADPPDPDWKIWTFSDSYLSPQRTDTDGRDWKPFLPANAKLPLFIADYSNPFHTAHWPGIFYAGFRTNVSVPGHPIDVFVRDVKSQIKAQNPQVVIIDLRLDQGGDFTSTADLMTHITMLAPSIKRVYVLTSAWTFSAGNSSVAFMKDHGGDKVTIVGELIGDRLRMWGEGGTMTLPNSKIIVHYATGLHDYTKSCWGQRGCFWILHFYQTHVASVAPDVTIPYSFADYRALRDPVMDYVLKASQQQYAE
jgi:hypothetical protein